MRKILCLLALLAIMITMVSCSAAKVENPISYGKKYILNENTYYVFNRDQTGYCEYYSEYRSDEYPEYDYTQSARIEFEWREASNGAIYLFETEVVYHEDHTEGKSVYLIDCPIYFAEEFFTYTNSNQYSTDAIIYIKEGSKLEKALENKE